MMRADERTDRVAEAADDGDDERSMMATSTPIEPGEIWLFCHTIRIPPIAAMRAAKA